MLILMLIFSLLVLFTVYVGSLLFGVTGPIEGLEENALSQGPTVILLFVSEFIGFIGPIIALSLSFDVIVKERVQNSLALLLSRPVSRRAIALGKFLGVFAALAVPVIVVNLVSIGLAIVLSGKGIGIDQAAGFLILTMMFLATYLAIGQLISSLTRTTTTAILAGIGVWFFFWLFLTIIQVILNSDIISLFNPGTSYSKILGSLLGGFNTGFLVPLWGYYLIAAARLAVPLIGDVAVFHWRDE
jgi:ABC-type transport system involved in multi-copper enzyme maturation permease subunit